MANAVPLGMALFREKKKSSGVRFYASYSAHTAVGVDLKYKINEDFDNNTCAAKDKTSRCGEVSTLLYHKRNARHEFLQGAFVANFFVIAQTQYNDETLCKMFGSVSKKAEHP